MRAQFRALKDMKDTDIDYSDIPETTTMDLSNTFTGNFIALANNK